MPHAERNKSHELEVCGSKVKMQFSGYFWGHRWTRHIMFAMYINFCLNPGKVNFSAFWWPFWKSQPNWKFWKFRKHIS
jgi:hypothetical protein